MPWIIWQVYMDQHTWCAGDLYASSVSSLLGQLNPTITTKWAWRESPPSFTSWLSTLLCLAGVQGTEYKIQRAKSKPPCLSPFSFADDALANWTLLHRGFLKAPRKSSNIISKIINTAANPRPPPAAWTWHVLSRGVWVPALPSAKQVTRCQGEE